MTRYIISGIIAGLFIVLSLSMTLIPCNNFLDFCALDGAQNYFYTNKITSPTYAGGLAVIIVFFTILFLTYLIVPPRKVVKY